MPTQLNMVLPRPIAVKGKSRRIVTLDDALHYLCAAAGKVKSVAPLNKAVVAVRIAAESGDPVALEAAAKKVERLVAHCSKD
ncbi:hypothetical protein ABLE91_28810 [Aquabacter sp. CN5-332]|uniref:hypothetical protein n=1 Tax=Aquabacter sp. CN5-332 TaxID=3156608 RepID=UPI0032B3D806